MTVPTWLIILLYVGWVSAPVALIVGIAIGHRSAKGLPPVSIPVTLQRRVRAVSGENGKRVEQQLPKLKT